MGTQKWKDISGSWMGRINIAKTYIQPKTIHRVSKNPTKIPMKLWTKVRKQRKIIRKCLQNNEKPQRIKEILTKKRKGGSIKIPSLKIYYKATVTKHHDFSGLFPLSSNPGTDTFDGGLSLWFCPFISLGC
jgi:hypothetical protein